MAQVNGKEIIKRLKKHGWTQSSGGRHIIMKKRKVRVPIPSHGSKDVPIGTIKNIEKITGIKLL